jgi:hypothetical protein
MGFIVVHQSIYHVPVLDGLYVDDSSPTMMINYIPAHIYTYIYIYVYLIRINSYIYMAILVYK